MPLILVSPFKLKTIASVINDAFGIKVQATWDASNKGNNVTLSGANLTQANTGGDGIVHSIIGVVSGKWYWEYKINSMNTVGAVGISNGASGANNAPLGIAGQTWSYNSDGNKYTAGGATAYGQYYFPGDVIGVKLDMDAGTLEFTKNGVSQGVAFSTGIKGITIYAASGKSGQSVTANFGATAFAYPVPAGYNSGMYETVGTATWNPIDKGTDVVLSNSNLTVSKNAQTAWRSVRATKGKSSGKAIYELSSNDNSPYTEMGFGNSAANVESYISGGICMGFQPNNGFDLHQGVVIAGPTPASTVGPYMFALDLTNGRGWIAVNGVWVYGNPATNTNPSFTWTPGTLIFPMASVYNPQHSVTINVGAIPFTNPIPSGFNPGW